MDVSCLETGMVVKNYRTLCELLGVKPVTGKQKKLQLKEFSRYFEYEKIKGSQRIIIVEIYEQPKEKTDSRKNGNHNIYVKSIEVVLLHYLSQQLGNTATFTKLKMWKMLGMVSDKYRTLSNNKLKEMDYCITDYEINHFYQRTNSKLTRILHTALENLQRQFIIDFEEEIIVVTDDNRYFVADDQQKKNIMQVKYNVLHEMGFEDERQVFLKMKTTEFYNGVNYWLDKLYGWKYTFKRYKVIYCDDVVRKEITRHERDLQREILNTNIVNATIRAAESNYTNSKDREFKLPDTYLQAQNLLTDTLIKLKSKDDDINFVKDDMNELDAIYGF